MLTILGKVVDVKITQKYLILHKKSVNFLTEEVVFVVFAVAKSSLRMKLRRFTSILKRNTNLQHVYLGREMMKFKFNQF